MAIHATCPKCSKGMTFSRRYAGTQVLCPLCGTVVPLPGADTAIRRARGVCPPGPTKSLPVPAPRGAPTRIAWQPPAMHYRVVAGAAAVALVMVGGLVALAVVFVKHAPPAAGPVAVAAVPAVDRKAEPAAVPEPAEEQPLPAKVEPQDNPATRLSPPALQVEFRAPPTIQDIVRQRNTALSDEDLRKQLLRMPELALDPDGTRKNAATILAKGRRLDQPHFTPNLLDARADLVGLPLRRGADCQLGKEPAENLQDFSRKMRRTLAEAQTRGDPGQMADTVKRNIDALTGYVVINGQAVRTGESVVPTIMQMLCVENQQVRMVVIDHLTRTKHRQSSEALVKMALYDLSERVRTEAVKALADRPREEYRQMLLDGLRYPWAPVADHAAEALVSLDDREAVPALKQLTGAPDPSAPYYDWTQKTYVTREVVRINHLGNCLMCHAPSTAPTDLVRGRIPTPGEPLPPPVQYYESQEGIFVRADVTYLKQDFSVVQPVDNHGPWPQMQRFDYVVRTRPLTQDQLTNLRRDAKAGDNYPQKAAVLYALNQLQGVKQARREEVADRP